MTGKTKYDLDRGNRVVYSLHYHIIFVIKYRRKALYNDKIRERLKEIFRDLAPTLKIEITGIAPAPGINAPIAPHRAAPIRVICAGIGI